MQNVIIFGSRSIRILPVAAIQSIERIKQQNFHVLVGDCYGVDLAVQKELLDYYRVTVCYADRFPRNNLGFNTKQIRDSYLIRDYWMCSQAKYGLAIWDGRSPGSLRNIKQLGSKCKVIRV